MSTRRAVAFFAFQTLMNFSRRLREQEQATAHQDEIPSGDWAPQDNEERTVSLMIQAIESKSRMRIPIAASSPIGRAEPC